MAVHEHERKYLDVYYRDILSDNAFKNQPPNTSRPPRLAEVRHLIPTPIWNSDRGQVALAAYERAWEIAFNNLRSPVPGSGHVSPYHANAFNDHIFIWDSCFGMQYFRFAHRAFQAIGTLDNLYAHQHPDGFISREVSEKTGHDRFHRYDPASTGPNVLAWTEWLHYEYFHDRERLSKVFPVLLRYHEWMRDHRTWIDGSYHSCGLATGMDNQPRVLPGQSAWVSHSHLAWIDATCQAALSASSLVRMAEELYGRGFGAAKGDGRKFSDEVFEVRAEAASLKAYVNECMWDEEAKFFVDRKLQKQHSAEPFSKTLTVGAYWALVAECVSPDRIEPFVAHLDDPAQFNRPVRVPSLSAADPHYVATGGYWLGGVWPPTTYMVLRGLTQVGQDDIAADIGGNYMDNVARLQKRTGTIWENMAPEYEPALDSATGLSLPAPRQGDPAKADFCGWGGIGPVSVLLEYVFGIRPNVPAGEIVWDIRLTDEFGVSGYPFGKDGLLELRCEKRGTVHDEPVVTVLTNIPVRIVLRWGKGINFEGGVQVDRSDSPSWLFNERVIEAEPLR